MKQSVMTAPGKMEFREVPRPVPKPGEVLLATRRIGVCGSDIHVYHGKHPYTSYPIVQGHEVSGEIVEIGKGVKGFTVGDRATFMPQLVCGKCYPCTHGMYHICDSLKVYGFQIDGAGQEFFPIPADIVLALPKGMSLEAGAIIEPLSVAVHALSRAGDVRGKKVLVLGAGPIGNLVAQSAKALGAAKVLVTDVSDFRLDVARRCGVDETANPKAGDLGEAIAKHLGPDKADVALECVGSEATIRDAIAFSRKGQTIVVVGVFGAKPVVDMGWVQDRELNIFGTLMYQRRDYQKAIELAGAGTLSLETLVTDTFPFDRYLDAYLHIEKARDRVMKVMISL